MTLTEQQEDFIVAATEEVVELIRQKAGVIAEMTGAASGDEAELQFVGAVLALLVGDGMCPHCINLQLEEVVRVAAEADATNQPTERRH